MRLARINRLLLAAGLLVLCVAAAAADAAVEHYIPRDAIAVLKVTDLEGRYAAFKDGALLARLKDPTFMPMVAARINEAEAALDAAEQQDGVELERLFLDVLGNEVALVGLPNDLGVFVAEAAGAGALQRAVEQFIEMDRGSGELLGTTSSDYKGVAIHADDRTDGTRYRAVSGKALAISKNRAAVERVIDAVQGAPALAASELYQEAQKVAPAGAIATAYVNTTALRPLAQALRQQAATAPRRRELGKLWLAEALEATRYVVASLREEDGPRAHLTVVYEEDAVPAMLEPALPEVGAKLDILDLAPPDAVLAGARNLNAGAVYDAFLGMAQSADPNAGARVEAAMDALVAMVGGVYTKEQLFGELEGQSALFVTPGAAGNLPGLTVAVRLTEGTHIPTALESIVGAAVIAARAEGQREVSLRREEHGGSRLTTVRFQGPGPWAKQLSPTFGMVGDDLVLASTKEAAQGMVRAAAAPAPRRPAGLEGTVYEDVRLDVGRAAGLLEENRELLVRHAVRKEGKTPEQARSELVALGKLLSLFQAVRFTSAFGEGRTDHELAVRMAPLPPTTQ